MNKSVHQSTVAGQIPRLSFFERIRFPAPFMIIVVIPTALTLIYYLLIAAPMYVSEAKFVVRSPSEAPPAALGSVLQSAGITFGQSDTDAYIVHTYITSREGVADLMVNHDLKTMLARPKIDLIARAPRPFERPTFENMYRDFSRFVTVGYDSTTGISTLRVKAFTAQDASTIANALLDGGERVINTLNERAAHDAVAEANRRISEAEDRVASAEQALTNFRNQERIIDPERTSVAGLDLVGKLDLELDTLRAQQQALRGSAPISPQLPEINHQIEALEGQVQIESDKMAGDNASLAPKIGEYERLILDREFAAKELTEVSASLETARMEARRKRLYLERVVPPNTPDEALMPQRIRSVAMTFITCLLIYGIIMLIAAGFREHQQT